jgi:multicomponent Na+:H+ antiporter subunit B
MIALFEDVIIQTVCRLLIPPMQLFALYVIAHGHYSPGGGFQGGVILGASFILLSVAYSIEEVKKRMSEKLNVIFCSLGVIIFSGVGIVCLTLGGNYLDYGWLHQVLPANPVEARSLGILFVEIGVGLTVMAVMISIFLNLASEGKHEDAVK